MPLRVEPSLGGGGSSGGITPVTGSASVAQATTQTIASVVVTAGQQTSYQISVDAAAANDNTKRQSKVVQVTLARPAAGNAYISRYPCSVVGGITAFNWVWSVVPTATGFDLQVTTPGGIGNSTCACWIISTSDVAMDPAVVAETPVARFGTRILAMFDLSQTETLTLTPITDGGFDDPRVGYIFDARDGRALSNEAFNNGRPIAQLNPNGTMYWAPASLNGLGSIRHNGGGGSGQIYWGKKISRMVDSDFLIAYVLNVVGHGALCDFQNPTSTRLRVDSNQWYNGAGFSSSGGVLGVQVQTWEFVNGTNGIGRYYQVGGGSGVITNNLAYVSRQLQNTGNQSFLCGDFFGNASMNGYIGYAICIHSPVAGDEAALVAYLRQSWNIV